ncbi:glycoside hydrolase family 30 protein [Amycolatopsis anabasis]|uniref:glycoside hydrolase family 30 protein n=1 Tax=Amycolatopsis anabasis TaxID=1840409 RepID=UPI00131D04AE|nr:glycoside hydrolase family 30 beta sandwich domain-containing protein [Amycolatopsis anabasis]
MSLVLSLCALVTACTVAGVPHPDTEAVQSWVTTADGRSRMDAQATLRLTAGASSAGSGPVITLSPGTTYQTMRGFGASFTGSSASLVHASPRRDEVMRRLFDPHAGIGLSALRQPMGASDFSTDFYTYDDVPAGSQDWKLAKFSVDRDRATVIPLLRQAAALNPRLSVTATPWTPPAWMKDNESLTGGSLTAASFHTYAQYFVRFLRAYAEAGVRVGTVTPQNEPENPAGEYPSARMSADAQSAFIGNDLGPALAEAGLGDTRILAYDHNWDGLSYPESVLADGKARKYVDGVAFHCYQGDVAAQSALHERHPELAIELTECSGTEGVSEESTFADTLLWQAGRLLVDGTRNWASSVLTWNIALDPENGPARGWCRNCTGLLTVDNKAGRVDYNASYYVLGHASKFVQPGAVRIDSAGGDGLGSVAFRNPDGGVAVIVLNPGDQRTFDLSLNGKHVTTTQPARSLATYLLH